MLDSILDEFANEIGLKIQKLLFHFGLAWLQKYVF